MMMSSSRLLRSSSRFYQRNRLILRNSPRLSAATRFESNSPSNPFETSFWLAPKKGTGFDNFDPPKGGDSKDGDGETASDDKKKDSKGDDFGKWSGFGTGGQQKGGGGWSGGGGNNNWGPGLFAGLGLMLLTYAMMEYIKTSTKDENSDFAVREISWNDLVNQLLDQKQVEKIVVVDKKTTAKVFLKAGAPGLPVGGGGDGMVGMSQGAGRSSAQFGGGSSGHRLVYRFAIGSVDTFERKLDDAQQSLGIEPHEQVPVQYTAENTIASEIFGVVPSLLLMGVLFAMLRGAAAGGGGGGRGGMGGIFQVGKSTAKKISKEEVNVDFGDVAGCQEAKKEIMEFVDFLADPTRFTKLGAKIPKGALLCGPPGTGKTLLAKAVAGEAGVPFYSVSGSDFIEMFVGVGPSRVRDLFKEARANAPCIIFIDEIDAVGRQRGRGGMGGNDERENTLNQLLVEMDGFSPSIGVVVLAGTNRIDILDQALTRPGRFDRQVQVDKPDLEGRKEIFQVHLKGVQLEDEVDDIAGRLAGLTPGFAGADIANICNEAAIVGARRAAETVSMADFEKAIDRVVGGLESNKIMSKEERSIVAHHEAGHAVAGWFLEHADPLLKVTIIPRSSGALGFAQYLPKEVFLRTHDQIMDIVCMALAGRAAEEIFFGRVTTGASDDLRRVTDLVYSTIQVYGMNERLGQLAFPKDPNAQFDERPYSDATATAMDEEAKNIVDVAYERTLNLLREHKEQVGKVASTLLEKETITHDDILDVVGPRPFKADKQYEEYIRRKQEDKEKDAAKDAAVEEAKEETDAPLSPGLA